MSNKYINSQYLINNIKIDSNKTLLSNNKNDVIKDFITNLNQKNVKHSINLACELHLSGYFENVLFKLINFYINEINLSQPIGSLYLCNILKYYKNKFNNKKKKDSMIDIVNDQKLRNFICFFVTLSCLSNQRKLPKLIKINEEDFNLKLKKKTLISKNLNLINQYIKKDDPKEITIPLSEIINLLKDEKIQDREQIILYWLSWIYEYEKRFHNKNMISNTRNISDIDKKYFCDFVWIIWEMIINFTEKKHLKTIIKNNCYLFKYKYTKSSKKTKSNLLINAVLLCINPIPKIKEPIFIEDDIFQRCNLESLNSNIYCEKIIQKKFINDTVK